MYMVFSILVFLIGLSLSSCANAATSQGFEQNQNKFLDEINSTIIKEETQQKVEINEDLAPHEKLLLKSVSEFQNQNYVASLELAEQLLKNQFIQNNPNNLITTYQLKAANLKALKEHSQEISTYNKIIDLFKNHKPADIQDIVAQVWLLKISTLTELGLTDETLKTVKAFKTNFDGKHTPLLNILLASARAIEIDNLSKSTKYQLALNAIDEMVSEYRNHKSDPIQEIILKALLAKGLIYQQLEQHSNAISAFNKYIEASNDNKKFKTIELEAFAWFKKVSSQIKIKEFDDALTTLSIFINNNSTSDSKVSSELVWRAYNQKSSILESQKKQREYIQNEQAQLNFIENKNIPNTEILKIQAYLNIADTFDDLKDYESAIKNYDNIIEIYNEAPNPDITRHYVHAMYRKGFLLNQEIKNYSEALKTTKQIYSQFKDSKDPFIQERTASALLHKAIAQARLKRYDEAISTNKYLLKKHVKDNNEEIQYTLMIARYNLACEYSLKRDKENTKKALISAFENGFNNFKHLSNDSDFDHYKNEEWFEEIVNKYKPD